MDKAMDMLFNNVKEVHFEVKHRATEEYKEIWMLVMLENETHSRFPLAFRNLCMGDQRIIMETIEEYVSKHYFNYQFQRVTAINDIKEKEKQKLQMLYYNGSAAAV
jgi:hypothetical protein